MGLHIGYKCKCQQNLEPLYLYEPAEPKTEDSRRDRDAVIARILANPPYAKLW